MAADIDPKNREYLRGIPECAGDGLYCIDGTSSVAVFYQQAYRRLKSAENPSLSQLLEANPEDFIGKDFVDLPDSGFWDRGDLAIHNGKSGKDFLVAASAFVESGTNKESEIIRIGYVGHETDTVYAFADNGACIGVYEGPSLKVDPVWRGRGIGKLLVAVKALENGGANPQAECDEVGYTPAGLAATIAGFEIAKDIARQFSTIAPDLFEKSTPRPRMG